MNIIKSSLILVVALCTTTLLYGQQAKNENNKPPQPKTETAKEAEVKPPPQVVQSNIPSPQAELKPQVAGEKPVAAQTPKSLVGEEEIKPQEKEKPEMKVAVHAFKAEDQKQGPTTPNTIDKNPKMIPATKSTASKQQQ